MFSEPYHVELGLSFHHSLDQYYVAYETSRAEKKSGPRTPCLTSSFWHSFIHSLAGAPGVFHQ